MYGIIVLRSRKVSTSKGGIKMKYYMNDYGVVITALCVDELGQLTYKMEHDGKITYRCVKEENFYNMIKLNNYKEMN